MRYLLTLGLLLWAVSASAFTINGKTYSTWNGKTLASWNGKTMATGFDVSTFETDNNGWTATADFDTFSGRESVGSTAHTGSFFYNLIGGNDSDTTYYDGIMSRTFPTLKNGTLTLWAVTSNADGATLQVSVSGGTVTPSGTVSIHYDGSVTPVWTQYSWVISGITNGTSHTVTIKNTYTVDGAVQIDDISVPIQ